MFSFIPQESLEVSEEAAMQSKTTPIVYATGFGESVVQWNHPEPRSKRRVNRAAKRLARRKKRSPRKFSLRVELEQSLMGGTYFLLWERAMTRDCDFLQEYLNEMFQEKGLLVTEVTLNDGGRVDYKRNCVVRVATIQVV